MSNQPPRMLARKREMDTSAMRTSLSWPRPNFKTFHAKTWRSVEDLIGSRLFENFMLPTFPTVLQSHGFVEIVLLSKTSAKSRERRRRGHYRLESIFSSSTSSFKAALRPLIITHCILPDWNANKEFGEKTYRHMNRIEAPHMQSFMIQAFSAKDMTSAMLVKQNKFTSPRTGV